MNPSLRQGAVTATAILLFAINAMAFVPGNRWSTTASGPTGRQGDPITLTWSFVPDGTTIPGEGPSDLISFLDSNLGIGPGGSDLTQRPWFRLFKADTGKVLRLDELHSQGRCQLAGEPVDDLPCIAGNVLRFNESVRVVV